MTPEQKEEWLAAAKCKLDGEEVEYWGANLEKWHSTDAHNPMHITRLYRPKPEPQQLYVYWDDDSLGGVAGPSFSKTTIWDNILKISLDDLIKHGERIK